MSLIFFKESPRGQASVLTMNFRTQGVNYSLIDYNLPQIADFVNSQAKTVIICNYYSER